MLPFNVTVVFSNGYRSTKKIFAKSYEDAKIAPSSTATSIELWLSSPEEKHELRVSSVQVVPIIDGSVNFREVHHVH